MLVFQVTERPTVKEATIVGNDELSKDDLKDTVEVKPFTILDLVAVKKDVKKIQEKYVEKGYYLAEVTYAARAAARQPGRGPLRGGREGQGAGEGDPVPRQQAHRQPGAARRAC